MKTPHAHAPASVTYPLQLVDERASHAEASGFFHDGNFVEEEFAALVWMEDLDRGKEPFRKIVDVAEQQVMPLIFEEPPRLIGDHPVVERRLEQRDLAFVAGPGLTDTNARSSGIAR